MLAYDGLGSATPQEPYEGQAHLSLEEPGFPRKVIAMNLENVQARQRFGTTIHFDPTIGQTFSSSNQRGLAQPQQGSFVCNAQRVDALLQPADLARSQSSQLGQRRIEDPVISYQRGMMADLRREKWEDTATIEKLEAENSALKTENNKLMTMAEGFRSAIADLKSEKAHLQTEIADLKRADSSHEPSAIGELPGSPQLSPGSGDGQSYLTESCPDTSSQCSSQSASTSGGRSETCPNCGADHPLKHCPCPNTQDGRLQACLKCDNTDHPWFRCPGYQSHDLSLVFYVVYVCRQGLCPLVHNEPLHELWANCFPFLDPSIQELTLQRPGPLTPQFVLRMLQDGGNDPVVGRQMTYGHRLLPWDLSKEVLGSYKLRVASTVLDPDTIMMSHKVVYKDMNTSDEQEIETVGAQRFRGVVNDVSMLDRHNLKSREALVRELQFITIDPPWAPDCLNKSGKFCMRLDCIYPVSAKHCISCGMEQVLGTETLFTLPRESGATLARSGQLLKLSKYWHRAIHKQWIREDIKHMDEQTFAGVLQCRRHPEIYQTAENLQNIRANTLAQVAEKLKSNSAANYLRSFSPIWLPECPECFAEKTLGLGDYIQRIVYLPSKRELSRRLYFAATAASW